MIDIKNSESKIDYYINYPKFSKKEKQLVIEARELVIKNELNKAYDIYFNLLNQISDNFMNKRKLRFIKIEIGQIYIYAEKWDAALQAFAEAISDNNSVGNPLLHLRIGQCAYKLNMKQIYEDNLSRALITGGLKIFENEDTEYKEIVLGLLKPPVEGWDKYTGIDFDSTK